MYLLRSTSGFTLIELIAVIVILALVSSFTVFRLDTLFQWKQNHELREFINTWQLLSQEALGRGERYRLIVDLDTNSYFVRREVRAESSVVKQVDYLKNFRLKSERERRAKKEEEKSLSLEEEFSEEDRIQSKPLETLFYRLVFEDPAENIRLTVPLEFPELAERKNIGADLQFQDVSIGGETQKDGEAAIRLSRGRKDFVVVHFKSPFSLFTAFMNPATGTVTLKNGRVDFENIGLNMHEQ